MPAAKLDLSALSSHLRESANIFRGPVDATDFRTCIFPLLFFQRGDCWDEDTIANGEGQSGDRRTAANGWLAAV